jgi:hypothetical protein
MQCAAWTTLSPGFSDAAFNQDSDNQQTALPAALNSFQQGHLTGLLPKIYAFDRPNR